MLIILGRGHWGVSQRQGASVRVLGQFWGDLGSFKRCCWVWEGVTPKKRNRQGWRREEEEEALMC